MKFALSFLLALLASTASATPTVEFKGFAFESNSSTSSYVATVTPPGGNPEQVYVGGYTTIVNGTQSFVSYCIDLNQSLQFNVSPYTNYTISSTGTLPEATVITLGKLFAGVGNSVTSAKTSAALQLAVWEVVYEPSRVYNVTNGTMIFSTDESVQKQANQFLSMIGTASVPLQFLTSPTLQDVVAVSPLLVPEPAKGIMFALGLGAIGVLRLRRTKDNV